MKNQKNGNNQVNEAKDAFNNKVAKLKNLGSTKRRTMERSIKEQINLKYGEAYTGVKKIRA